MDLPADPSAVQTVQVAIDAHVGAEVQPFWRAVLGYEQDGPEDLVDPYGRRPSIWFQEMDVPRHERNRLHIDVSVPHDQAEARGADAEGNEVDRRHLDGSRLGRPAGPRSQRSVVVVDGRGRRGAGDHDATGPAQLQGERLGGFRQGVVGHGDSDPLAALVRAEGQRALPRAVVTGRGGRRVNRLVGHPCSSH